MGIQIHAIRKGTTLAHNERVRKKLEKKYPSLYYQLEVSGMIKK
jgi:hypothetical protein